MENNGIRSLKLTRNITWNIKRGISGLIKAEREWRLWRQADV
jgi:hypothetical protein